MSGKNGTSNTGGGGSVAWSIANYRIPSGYVGSGLVVLTYM